MSGRDAGRGDTEPRHTCGRTARRVHTPSGASTCRVAFPGVLLTVLYCATAVAAVPYREDPNAGASSFGGARAGEEASRAPS